MKKRPIPKEARPSFAPFLDPGVNLLLIGLGSFLIETHRTLAWTLWGMGAWAFALYRFQSKAAPLPAFPLFNGAGLFPQKRGKEWNGLLLFLAAAGCLLFLRLSRYFLEKWDWGLLVLALLLLGAGFLFLERGSSVFWKGPEADEGTREFPWREGSLFLVGAFFLFYRLDVWPDRAGGESFNTLMGGYDFVKGRETTPFVDVWEGNPYLPCLILAPVIKIFGPSYLATTAAFAAINLAGGFFLYGFLKFYLERNAAWATTVLFFSSHWFLFMARQTFEGASIIVPAICATLYFFARAVEKGRMGDFILFGTGLAVVLNTYMSSRYVLVFFILTTVLLWVLRTKSVKGQAKGWAAAWASFALWYSPMVLFYLHRSGGQYASFGFSQRMAEINILAICKRQGDWSLLWENIKQGAQMFTFHTTDTWTAWFPFLSPWESLGLFAGLAWCLSRLYRPAAFLALMGFLGGMSASVLSNMPTHTNRALAGSPFVYLLIGIGLDRLARVLAAPMPSKAPWIKGLFTAVVLVFSLSWQYDIYFQQLPKSITGWHDSGGKNFLAGKYVAGFPQGWDFYFTVRDHFSYEIFSPSKRKLEDFKNFFPNRNFPLNERPSQGSVVVLPAGLGEAMTDWFAYWYPDSKPKALSNFMGNNIFWAWEIGPAQMDAALVHEKQGPPSGLKIVWIDKKGHPLTQWRVPTLFPDLAFWFDHPGGTPDFPFAQTDSCVAQGWVQDPGDRSFMLESVGTLEGSLGGQPIHLTGPLGRKRVVVTPKGKGWIPFRIKYQGPSQNFTLALYRLEGEGWRILGAQEYHP